MFLCCAALCNYWTTIFKTLSEITATPMEPNAITTMFGISKVPWLRLQADLIAFVTFVGQASRYPAAASSYFFTLYTLNCYYFCASILFLYFYFTLLKNEHNSYHKLWYNMFARVEINIR